MEKELKPGKLLKSSMIKEYAERLKDASSYFVTEFTGLTNKELEELRKKLRSVSGQYIILKNSISKLAFKKMEIKDVDSMISGSCALSYGRGDPVSISKVLVDFSKNNKALRLKGAYIDGRVVTPEGITELAALPSRKVLLARLVSCLNSPITGFVCACSGIVRKFVCALNEITKKRQS